MRKIYFDVDGDYIYRHTPLNEMSNTYQLDVVMDRQTFIEAYKKWIAKDKGRNQKE